ncbi:hypothetical protein AB0D57_34710 [Streptomyces sp. NPDC048275]|uniref:hypothetical protein n=1 Tax=Streptomyces sp. NPDC048275 TaxID=3155629 RepID=UPI0034118CFB
MRITSTVGSAFATAGVAAAATPAATTPTAAAMRTVVRVMVVCWAGRRAIGFPLRRAESN